MRLRTVSMLAIATAIGTAGLLLGARPPAVAAADDLRPIVTVVGDGRVTVEPDVAYVTFGVEATGDSFAAAQADASVRMQAVIDTLIGLGVPREEIKTSRLSASPIYDQNDRTVIRGYRANNSVRVKLRDIDQVGAVVDAVTAAGANRVDGISFAVDQLEVPKDQAREIAMQNARTKADRLASLAGMRVVSVKAIQESDPTPPPAPPQPAAARAEGSFAAPPVEPGTQEVGIQVTVTYVME